MPLTLTYSRCIYHRLFVNERLYLKVKRERVSVRVSGLGRARTKITSSTSPDSYFLFKHSIAVEIDVISSPPVTPSRLKAKITSTSIPSNHITFQKMHHSTLSLLLLLPLSLSSLHHPSLQPPPLSPHLPLIQQFLTQPNNPPRPKSNHTRGTKSNCHGRIHRS